MSDPHADDYCVVCGISADAGRIMHPVASIQDGCVCDDCIGGATAPVVGTDEIKVVSADSRGRVCLGTDYANKEVRVAVIEIVDD